MEGGVIYVKTIGGDEICEVPILGKACPSCLYLKEEICKKKFVKDVMPDLVPSAFELTRERYSDECIPHNAPIPFYSTVYIFMPKGRQKETVWAKESAEPKELAKNTEEEGDDLTRRLSALKEEKKTWVMPKEYQTKSQVLQETSLPLFAFVTFNNTTVRFEVSERGKKFKKFKRHVAKRLGVASKFALLPENGKFTKRVRAGDAFEIKIITK